MVTTTRGTGGATPSTNTTTTQQAPGPSTSSSRANIPGYDPYLDLDVYLTHVEEELTGIAGAARAAVEKERKERRSGQGSKEEHEKEVKSRIDKAHLAVLDKYVADMTTRSSKYGNQVTSSSKTSSSKTTSSTTTPGRSTTPKKPSTVDTQQARHARLYPKHPNDCQCWLFTGEDLSASSTPLVSMPAEELYTRLTQINDTFAQDSVSGAALFADLVQSVVPNLNPVNVNIPPATSSPSRKTPTRSNSRAPIQASTIVPIQPPPLPACISSHLQARDLWASLSRRVVKQLVQTMDLHVRTDEQAKGRIHAVRQLCRICVVRAVWQHFVQLRKSEMQIHDLDLVKEFTRDRLYHLGRDILGRVTQDIPLLTRQFRKIAPLSQLLGDLYLGMYTQFLPRTLAAAAGSLERRIEVLQVAVDFRHELHELFVREFPLVEHPRLISGLKNFTGFLRQNLSRYVAGGVQRAVQAERGLHPTEVSILKQNSSILASTRTLDGVQVLPVPRIASTATVTVVGHLRKLLPLMVIPECIDYIPQYTQSVSTAVEVLLDHLSHWLSRATVNQDFPTMYIVLGSALLLQTELITIQDVFRDLPFSHAAAITKPLCDAAVLAGDASQAICSEHSTVISTTIFSDLDQINWSDSHAWKEDKACSSGIQSYNMYLRGIVNDVSRVVAPATCQLIVRSVLDQSVAALIARYMFVSPSRKRLPQFRADIRHIIAIVRSFRTTIDDVIHDSPKDHHQHPNGSSHSSNSFSDRALGMLGAVLFLLAGEPRDVSAWLDSVLASVDRNLQGTGIPGFTQTEISPALTQCHLWNVAPISYEKAHETAFKPSRDAFVIGSDPTLNFDAIMSVPLSLRQLIQPCILTPLDVLNAIRRQPCWQKDVYPPLTEEEKKETASIIPLMARFKTKFDLTHA